MRANSAEGNTIYRAIDVEMAGRFGEWQASLTSDDVWIETQTEGKS